MPSDVCEEMVPNGTLFGRPCRGRGLRVIVHPGGEEFGRRVVCARHSLTLYLSGWLVDWEESARRFGTRRPKGRLRDGIGRP